jgi:hypothetical protein
MQAPPPTVLVQDVVGSGGSDRRTGIREKRYALFPAAVLVVSADREFEQGRRPWIYPAHSWVVA